MTTFANKPIPMSGKETRVFYKFNGPEQELKFVAWTTKYLVVKYPAGSQSDWPPSTRPNNWRMGRKLVNRWLATGVLRIEGFIPELALVE